MRRLGISLLEVLISIYVMAVGMISVAALILVGGVQINRANIEERKATLAQNAFREFQIRDLRNVSNWVRYNGTAWTTYLPLNTKLQFPPSTPYDVFHPAYPDFPFLPPVAIDPLMTAIGHEAGQDGVIAGLPAAYTAYANSPLGGPLMSRLSLNTFGNSVSSVWGPNHLLADAAFVAGDDTVVNRPDDSSSPGTSGLIYADAPNNFQPMKREYSGQYSWMAVITSPGRPTLLPVAPPNSIRLPQVGDALNLAIVIFNERQMTVPVPATDQGGQEELVEVHWNTSNPGSQPDSTVNIGGGEFTLTDSNATFNATGRLGMVQANQWVMLCRYCSYHAYTWYYYPDPNSDFYYIVNVYYPWLQAKWYRVVAVGSVMAPSSTSNYTRQVTLVGPDWEPEPAPPPSEGIVLTQILWPSTVPANSQNFNTYALILDGVVGVYQHSIQLSSN